MPIGSGWIAGIDGCPAGWMLVLAPLDGPFAPRLEVLPRLSELGALGLSVAALAIDMPIGLPDRIDGAGRGAEKAVRKLLGARQSSVFSIPVRAAVEALEYRAACAAAEAGSDPPRKIAKQAFNLFPKIRELDSWIRGDCPPTFPVIETHPELVFRQLKGVPLVHPKKTLEGKTERSGLLLAAGIPAESLRIPAPKGAAQDDLIDAWACLVTARRFVEGTAKPHPENFERDRFGLPMAIFA